MNQNKCSKISFDIYSVFGKLFCKFMTLTQIHNKTTGGNICSSRVLSRLCMFPVIFRLRKTSQYMPWTCFCHFQVSIFVKGNVIFPEKMRSMCFFLLNSIIQKKKSCKLHSYYIHEISFIILNVCFGNNPFHFHDYCNLLFVCRHCETGIFFFTFLLIFRYKCIYHSCLRAKVLTISFVFGLDLIVFNNIAQPL